MHRKIHKRAHFKEKDFVADKLFYTVLIIKIFLNQSKNKLNKQT